MPYEDSQRSVNIRWLLIAIPTLIFVFGTSISLMNFFAKIVQWNGNLGEIVNSWDLKIVEPFENLFDPFAKWIGWHTAWTDWLSNYLVFGCFFYTLILFASKLLSKWDKDNWVTLAITWPLGVLAWPGMITLMVRTLIEDYDQPDIRKLISIVFSPFLIFTTLLIVNFWA